MYIVIKRQSLTTSLRLLSAVAERLPGAGVLLKMSDDGLEMVCANYTALLSCHVPGSASHPADVCVNAEKYIEIMGSLSSADVILRYEVGGMFVITCGRSSFKLATYPVDAFPLTDRVIGVCCHVDSGYLSGQIHETEKHMAHRDKARPYLNGTMFEIKEGIINAVSSDAFRLAISAPCSPSGEISENIGCIIPCAAVPIVKRLLSAITGDVSVIIGTGRIEFSTSEYRLSACLVDSHYPDYEKLIPEDNNNHIVVNRESMLSTLDRAGAAVPEDPRIEFDISESSFTIRCAPSWSGVLDEFEETIDADTTGNVGIVGINRRYLADALNSIREENVILSLGGARDPVTVHGSINKKPLYIVMPLLAADKPISQHIEME